MTKSISNACLPISTVSEKTGIPKEVLRKWETRYGFALPRKEGVGTRMYPPAQLRRLQLIKRLLDDGMRPGQIVLLEEARLLALLAERGLVKIPSPAPEIVTIMLRSLQAHDPRSLREQLHGELMRRGLRDFILDAMPLLNEAVGAAWASGEVSISDEHLYTETVQALVRQSLSDHAGLPGQPRLVLTTLSGELHTLGLLMVEAVMTLEGASCVSLGAQLPLADIAAAGQAYRADIVGLSFSASFARKKIAPALREMRRACPAGIELWAGGAGVARMDKALKGVSVLASVEDAVKALKSHRRRHKRQGAAD
jgi:DNA-binding transcriptional MerR regulator/methylmalonyl-CoA mutase cobalamin-binding subunit